MRRLVEALIARVFPRAEANLHGLDGVGFVLLLLELLEDLGGLVWGRGPDDFEAGEGDGEEDELGLQVCGVGGWGDGGGVVGEWVECESLVLIELDEEHGVFVVLEHGLGLVEQPPVLEGGD